MGIFSEKKKKIENTVISKDDGTDEKASLDVAVIERPRICCLDVEEIAISALRKARANVYNGTLGSKVKVPKPSTDIVYHLLLNFDFPVNLHEYDIIIIDLNSSKTVDYKIEEHRKEQHTGRSSYYFQSRYPETLFDPRPFATYLLQGELSKISNRDFLVVAFSSSQIEIEYDTVQVSGGYGQNQIQKFDIYSFWDHVPASTIKSGEEIIVCKSFNDLQLLLEKYKKDMYYNQTFYHPEHYQGNQRVKDDDFFPLMKNMNDDIISFIHLKKHRNLILLPQIKNKTSFILELLEKVAPTLFPTLFPYSTIFHWKIEEEYWLPNHSTLLNQQLKIRQEFEKRLKESEQKIEENIERFSFLHEIISETGDKLTSSLIKFFNWFGFDNVNDFDKTNTNSLALEEDIQVKLPKGLLIIECKGIGGTSTDADCSQISKIKHRRCKERKIFDVFALYIVNHQRYLPPLNRKNPPFTNHQIEDAKNDERGLLTTWQLFQLYFDIEAGVITKEEAREMILEYGLIEFTPKGLSLLYEPNEIFSDGHVCIVNLDNVSLKVDDDLFIEKNGRFKKVRIISMQENGIVVNEASTGEVGLKVSSKIEKKSKIWKQIKI